MHNLKSITPILSIQVELVSYKYLLYNNNIYYTMSHYFIIISVFN
jgi:hypothetical protein